MHLSLREKRNFYQNLAQLVRAGIPLAAAMEKLAASSRGGPRQIVAKLRESLGNGHTISDAFSHLQPAVGEMECAAINALERTGRLDRGLQLLSEYFETMDNARRDMLKRLGYPLFLLHFGIIVSSVVSSLRLMPDTHAVFVAFAKSCAWRFGSLYVVVAALWFLLRAFANSAARNPTADWLFQRVFFLGKIHRAFALSRFCATYDMQLDAGVNVIDSLLAAGRASRSGRISHAVEETVPKVREGSRVGPALTESGVFPNSFTQTFLVSEESGELDTALRRLATEYQGEAARRVDILTEWLPRLIYIGILLYFGWFIISFYIGYYGNVMRQIDAIGG